MLALGLWQRVGIIEAVVEVRVQMADLKCEHRTKRTAIARESPAPLVHVVAACDRGGDGTIRGGECPPEHRVHLANS
jgi:hypothetical protein